MQSRWDWPIHHAPSPGAAGEASASDESNLGRGEGEPTLKAFIAISGLVRALPPPAPPEESTQNHPDADGHETDLQAGERRSKLEDNGMLTSGQLDAAHDEIAAKYREGFLIGGRVPILVITIIEQKNSSGRGINLHFDAAR